MASLMLHGSGSAAAMRGSKSQAKASAGSISSLRVRPFTKATRVIELGRQQSSLRTRAAEPELAGPTEAEEAFEFNYSDAKKANEYQASDVEAALRFYEGDGDAPGDANSEFVENVYGVEDASFFDDIDNNEAYDDEFIAAGIPEAAPKQRRGGPGKEGAEEEGESDEFAAAKEVAKLKQAEEQMVLEAELEETGLNKESELTSKAVGPAVWDWMGDLADEDDDEVTLLARGGSKRMAASVLAALPSDEAIFTDLRTANLADIDPDTKETIEFLLDDFDIEAELKVLPENVADAFDVPETADAQPDLTRIDALLGADLSLPELDVSSLASIPTIVDDGLTMSQEAVDKYIASLKATQAADMTDEEVKAMFADDPAAVELVVGDDAPVTMDDVDLSEPEITPLSEAELTISGVEDNLAEVEEVDEFRAELQSLQRMPEIAFEPPTDDEVDVLDQYLNASEQFIAEEENRRMQLAQQVAAGLLPADVLLEDSDDIVDVEAELLMPDDELDMDESAFDDDENWQERIIELSRVTKVVKGGKLMGFRCTAVVGNGKGLVGVGCQAGREVATAVKRALVDAKKSIVQVPLVGAGTIPHRVEAKFNAARCVVLPAADGTGVLAGSSIRSVLELAGVQNVLAKRLGCRSLLNNARCAVEALSQLRTLQEVSKARGVPMERLLLPRE